MKLNFEIIREVGAGKFPDVLDFANTQAELFSIKDGKLHGKPTNAIGNGEWDGAVFQNELNISPDFNMTNFELKIMPGWGAVGSYRSGNSHRMLIYEFDESDYRNYVSYKSYIDVRDSNGAKMAYLSPQTDFVKDCYIDTRLNGESTLEFSIPAGSDKIDMISAESILYAGWKAYILRKDSATDIVRDDKNKLWAKFMAVERWYELDESYIEPSISNDPTAKPPADLAVIIVGGGSNLSGNRYATGSAAHALYAILKGSGWHLGTCDMEGIYDLEMEKVSRLELIKKVQNIWGGYLVWDSVNKVVNLRDPNKWQPYSGYQVRYKKNLKHITRTQSNKLVTKLYAFGHDDLDIANVNGGKKFVTNHSYTTREYVGIYKNQDIYSQQELLEKAIAELELICRPRYLYAIKMLDLGVLPDFSHEEFFLGEMIDVIDPDVSPDSPRPRAIRHKYNLFQTWKCELDIGDPEERLIEQLKASFNTTNFIDGKFNGNGDMSGNYLEDLTVGDAKIKNLDAEKITTGYLSADRIEAGSIAASKIKTDELIVGDNITIGVAGEGQITTITKNTITTEYINALEITAKKIGTTGNSYAEITGGVMRFYYQGNEYLLFQQDAWTGAGAIMGTPRLEFYGDVSFAYANVVDWGNNL